MCLEANGLFRLADDVNRLDHDLVGRTPSSGRSRLHAIAAHAGQVVQQSPDCAHSLPWVVSTSRSAARSRRRGHRHRCLARSTRRSTGHRSSSSLRRRGTDRVPRSHARCRRQLLPRQVNAGWLASVPGGAFRLIAATHSFFVVTFAKRSTPRGSLQYGGMFATLPYIRRLREDNPDVAAGRAKGFTVGSSL